MSRLAQAQAALVAEMQDVIAAIRVHGDDLLRVPNVIAVSPGYRFRAGRITHDPAVRVHVDRKFDVTQLPHGVLPRRLGRVLVDVVEASPRLQYQHRQDLARAAAGTLPSNWRISLLLPGDEEDADAALAGPLLPYVPPAEPAAEVTAHMTVVCTSSCDNGSRLLRAFFARTQTALLSTMYEFTARHLLDSLLASLPAPRTFSFIFDGKNKKLGSGDLRRQQVLQALESTLQQRLTFAWAANAQGGSTVSAGFFPSAYHIKVSVRDEAEVWLSSGNWKESGQPEIDPRNPPNPFDQVTFESDHNREWHVLIDSPELARQFARYIRHDIEKALPLQLESGGVLPPEEVMPDLFVPLVDEARSGPPVFHREQTVSKTLRALPLFTPDQNSYFDFVADLIANARSKIRFENQSLAPRANDAGYMDRLFLALRDRAREPDMDVKIIVRGDFDPTEIWNNLEAYKFPMDRVVLLGGVHTKGLIVDDEVVVIGSHNWTAQGTRQNRDASIAFWDPEIISYYNMLFDYDWNRGTDVLGPTPRLAQPGEATPPGFVRVPWRAGNN